MGALYGAATYFGQVDLGLKVTNIDGAYSQANIRRQSFPHLGGMATFNAATYSRTAQVAAGELNDPEAIARRVLGQLFAATTRRDDFDPFE